MVADGRQPEHAKRLACRALGESYQQVVDDSTHSNGSSPLIHLQWAQITPKGVVFVAHRPGRLNGTCVPGQVYRCVLMRPGRWTPVGRARPIQSAAHMTRKQFRPPSDVSGNSIWLLMNCNLKSRSCRWRPLSLPVPLAGCSMFIFLLFTRTQQQHTWREGFS